MQTVYSWLHSTLTHGTSAITSAITITRKAVGATLIPNLNAPILYGMLYLQLSTFFINPLCISCRFGTRERNVLSLKTKVPLHVNSARDLFKDAGAKLLTQHGGYATLIWRIVNLSLC